MLALSYESIIRLRPAADASASNLVRSSSRSTAGFPERSKQRREDPTNPVSEMLPILLFARLRARRSEHFRHNAACASSSLLPDTSTP